MTVIRLCACRTPAAFFLLGNGLEAYMIYSGICHFPVHVAGCSCSSVASHISWSMHLDFQAKILVLLNMNWLPRLTSPLGIIKSGCDVPGLNAVTSLFSICFAALTGDAVNAWRFKAQVVFDGTEKPRIYVGSRPTIWMLGWISSVSLQHLLGQIQ